MKKMIAIAVLCLPLAAVADDIQDRKQASAKVIQEFGAGLKGELERSMKEGGPGQAIDVCNRIAPAMAKEKSDKTGWSVGRTSLKTRNDANAPDAWETRVLQKFEERKAAGEDVQNIAFAEVVEQDGKKTFRFMKAIPTGEACLKCHGEKIDPAVEKKLSALYPNDKARGFKLGDIRGAFTISQPM